MQRTWRTATGGWSGRVMAAAAAVVMTACSAGLSTGGLDTLATTPTTRPAPPVVATDPSTTVAASLPDVGVQLSPDGPWRRVDGAPGVDTPGLFYELMPRLWVYLPTEEDLDHGITWTLGADDVPIIEAYLQALLVYYRAVTVDPMDLDDPGWEQWYLDGGRALRGVVAARRDKGQHGDLGDGVVLRPTVAGDERSETTALVADCILDGALFLNSDGSLAEGTRRGIGEAGTGARLQLVSGKWVAIEVATMEAACVG